MRKQFILFLLLCSAFTTQAHEYFFAFAEVDYNKTESILEITVVSSAHETEDALNLSGIAIKELEDHYTDKEMLAKLEKFVLDGFSLKNAGTNISLKLVGFEVNSRGMVEFYFKSEVIPSPTSFDVEFDLLMDQFPNQQNKLLFNYNNKTTTAVFLANKRSETITL